MTHMHLLTDKSRMRACTHGRITPVARVAHVDTLHAHTCSLQSFRLGFELMSSLPGDTTTVRGSVASVHVTCAITVTMRVTTHTITSSPSR